MQHVSASASSGDKRGGNSLKENTGEFFGKDFYSIRFTGALHTLKVYRTLDLTLSTLSQLFEKCRQDERAEGKRDSEEQGITQHVLT